MQSQKVFVSCFFRLSQRSWPWKERIYNQFHVMGIWQNCASLQSLHSKHFDTFQLDPFFGQHRRYRIWNFRSNSKSALCNQKKANKLENKLDVENQPSVTKITSSQNDLSNGISANEQEKEGILARFKNTYKRHGKVFIAVHLATSSIWAASFYCMVISGMDIINILQWMGFSEAIVQKLNSPSIGHIASTYVLYKLASPLRYMVTIAGTRWTVKYLQRSGRMPVTPEENKISSLLKEGGVNIRRPRRRRNNSPRT